MSRGISTVVDVTVCLLFVGAATAVLLTGTVPEPQRVDNPAAADAELLATSTTTVAYELSPTATGSAPPGVANATARRQRTAHGTVAQLLGDAAMSSVAVGGRTVSTARGEFRREIAAATQRRLRDRERLRMVRASWRPYPGSPVNATVRVGDHPPRGHSVRAATITVPSGMDDVSEPALAAARSGGYDAVGTVVARAIVDGLFPPERTRLALRGDYPADTLTAGRYRRMARLTGAGRLPLTTADPDALNRNLTAALGDRLATDLRTRFPSPVAAARTVETQRVTVTVRTWSP